MASSCRINEDDVKVLGGGVRDCVAGDIGGVFAVALFVEFDPAEVFSGRQFLEVSRMNAELFDSSGAESVACGDEEVEVVLEEEEGEFGEIGGFADAVDADDGDDVGAGFGGEGA